MLDLILIIFLIISIWKPEVLLAKKVREKADEEQKKILVKNLRKIYGVLIALLESAALMRYISVVGLVLVIVFLVLFFVFVVPAIKENRKIID